MAAVLVVLLPPVVAAVEEGREREETEETKEEELLRLLARPPASPFSAVAGKRMRLCLVCGCQLHVGSAPLYRFASRPTDRVQSGRSATHAQTHRAETTSSSSSLTPNAQRRWPLRRGLVVVAAAGGVVLGEEAEDRGRGGVRSEWGEISSCKDATASAGSAGMGTCIYVCMCV